MIEGGKRLATVGALCVISGVVTAAGFAARSAPMKPQTLCVAGETPYFACSIGRKLVAVCGNGKRATYRFGTPGHIKLSSSNLTQASTGYSGGGERQITAVNNNFSYTVYDRTVRTNFGVGGNNPESTSGLVIRRDGRTLAALRCKGDSSGEAGADSNIPEGEFIDLND